MTTRGNDGQYALVTGASGGIGLELARVLAANRFNLVLLARSRDRLEELASELEAQHGTKVTIVPADLSEPGAAKAVFDSLSDAGVQIELLVNNAGLLLEGRFDAIGLDEQLRLLQVNIVALTALTRLFLGPMLERKRGRILNVASVAAFMPVPNLAIYAASKAYVLSFGDALSQELGGHQGHRDDIVSRCNRYRNGSWHESWEPARHVDHGCKDGCSRGISSLHGGKAGPCRGNCERACGPMDQVSTELAQAGVWQRSWQKPRCLRR